MAHEFESGFFVKEAAWHKLGKVISEAPTITEGIEMAGLNWKVKLDRLLTSDGRPTKMKAVLRETDNSILGYAGEQWQPLQNDEAFLFFDEFLKTKEIKLEAAGSLRKGQRVWVLAKINQAVAEVVKGDPIQRYFLLSNAHTRGISVSVGFTDIRVVCKNTLAMAEKSRESKLIRVFHSSKTKSNLEEIKGIIDFSETAFRADVEKLKKLQRRGICRADIEKYVDVVFFKDIMELSKRGDNKKSKIVETIEGLIENGIGSDIKGVKGNAYGLYQATTEYFTHYDGDSYDKRLEKLWLGRNKRLNQSAMDYLLTV
jgi:phage/plasmid-like protein (TIGR03299 family)